MRDEETKKELRMQARLAWNNWPDNEASRKALTEHDQRDPFSAAAWDRVVQAILSYYNRGDDNAAQTGK